MPSRYYFAPVRGREGSVMSGVADGLERGVQNFENARHTAREVRRQEEQDKRRRLLDDVEMDEYLMSRGGGRGERPNEDVTMRGPADFARPDFEMPEFNPPTRGVGMRPPELEGGFEFNPVETSITRQDPRYRNVGPEGHGYVMTPEALEDEQFRREQGREGAARDALVGRLGPMASALTGGRVDRDDPQFGQTAIEMGADGFDAFAFLPPEEGGPEPWKPMTRDDFFLSRGRDPETGRMVDPRNGATDSPRMSLDQAMDMILDLYYIPGPETEPARYSKGFDEMYDMALELAEGGAPFAPGAEPPPARQETSRRDPEIGKAPGVRGFLERLVPGGESGYELTYRDPAGGPSASTRELSDEDVALIHGELGQFPRSEWRKVLSEEGATPEEIDRILKGRNR